LSIKGGDGNCFYLLRHFDRTEEHDGNLVHKDGSVPEVYHAEGTTSYVKLANALEQASPNGAHNDFEYVVSYARAKLRADMRETANLISGETLHCAHETWLHFNGNTQGFLLVILPRTPNLRVVVQVK